MYRVIPYVFLEGLKKYFRVSVEGANKIPRQGPVLFTPNHSGYSGLDAMMVSHILHQTTGRPVRVLTHHLWFLSKTTAGPAQKLGFIEATKENGIRFLNRNQQVVLFPEGERGNFKPTSKAYQLQEFKRGFIRLALKTQAPIVPTLVIGAEETSINLKQIELNFMKKNLILPLPFNLIPLPVKWKIVFLDPIYFPYAPESVEDSDLVHELCSVVKDKMQRALSDEVKKRNLF
ncbi:MAG: acyltransferase family protein [Bdellovibrionales bacterium]|nr:acyltransferase family protein [Bdellovibrionales bacterium]